MGLQYISDNKGKTTGVFIPIEDWNELKAKFKGLEEEFEVSSWQLHEAEDRLNAYKADPSNAQNFDQAMDDVEMSIQ